MSHGGGGRGAELRKQASEGKIRREEAAQKIVEIQQANTMTHIETSVKEGKTIRAEADALHKQGRWLLSHSVQFCPAFFLTNRKEVITIDWSVLP